MRIVFAGDGLMSSTLREMHQFASTPRTWCLLAIVSLIVGLTGPFGTYVGLALAERVVYWTFVVVGTFFVASFSLSLADRWLSRRIASQIAVGAIGALAAAIPISMLVFVAGTVFGMAPRAMDVANHYAQAAAITFGLTLLFSMLERNKTKPSALATPSILDRLPETKRGALVRIGVHDHYVDVITDQGRHLVLMRLKDAIGETAPEDGLRVHRSHWVAKRGIEGSQRKHGRLFLRMTDGTTVPISRTYLKAARQAGLLDR